MFLIFFIGSKESSKSNPPSPLRSPCALESPTQINVGIIVDDGPGSSTALLARFEQEEDQDQAGLFLKFYFRIKVDCISSNFLIFCFRRCRMAAAVPISFINVSS